MIHGMDSGLGTRHGQPGAVPEAQIRASARPLVEADPSAPTRSGCDRRPLDPPLASR